MRRVRVQIPNFRACHFLRQPERSESDRGVRVSATRVRKPGRQRRRSEPLGAGVSPCFQSSEPSYILPSQQPVPSAAGTTWLGIPHRIITRTRNPIRNPPRMAPTPAIRNGFVGRTGGTRPRTILFPESFLFPSVTTEPQSIQTGSDFRRESPRP